MASRAAAADRNEFNFPFAAYPIQTEFMTELTSTLEAGQIGIFESPTGTVRACRSNSNFECTSMMDHAYTGQNAQLDVRRAHVD